MRLHPKDLYEKLEFNKILDLLEQECLGELGSAYVRNILPETELPVIERKLLEVKELKRGLSNNDRVPVAHYHDVYQDLKMLDVEGYVLPVEGLQRINILLLIVRDVFQFFTPARQELYPALYDILRPLRFDEALLKAIVRVIDEHGEIRPDASPELQRIRRAVQSQQRELDKVFRNLINEYRSKGWLSDNVESFRNSRRVLSVPAEHKRKIRGIIHDESATGRTAFIEPEPVIEINNDIFDLEQEERREIYRILKELSELLRPYTPVLRQYQQLVARYDVIHAKARLALRLDADMPIVKGHPAFGTIKGYHPLLLLKNQATDRETVPFTLSLFGENRILVLSGPNAGGKSVAMKAVGLLQLMLQSGLLIPVDPLSEMGIFDGIFADIGDQQSLEDDLSTYSSRLKNMRHFLENAGPATLVLIDEFGSGTDPKIGGAIAEAILKELNEHKVYGVITTHFSNLKMFAYKTKGIVNGCMNFDTATLKPTYEMKVGRPGSSYAFEIAQNSGLGKSVLHYARHRTGKNEKAVDELLIDLQREKQELEEKLAGMEDREKKLERLIRNYEELHRDLEFKRKKLKLEIKEQEVRTNDDQLRLLDKLVREMREQKNIERAMELALKAKAEKEKAIREAEQIKQDLYAQPNAGDRRKGEIAVGEYVRLRAGGATGIVRSLDKNKSKAVVEMGQMQLTIRLIDLVAVNEPLEQQKKGIHTDIVGQAARFDSKIDLRGLRMLEAMKALEDFVDKALITSANSLHILHGKGDGILRGAVRQKLREYNSIKNVYHPVQEEGGEGVTIVEL